MNLTVLIACMHQCDHSILTRMNVQTDAVVINQTDFERIDKFSFLNKNGRSCNVLFINTIERGLSKSRNLALKYAGDTDICLICDDDEILTENYENVILSEFQRNPGKSIIAFRFLIGDNPDHRIKRFYEEQRSIGYWSSHNISSVQIAFRYADIMSENIRFDETLGAGVTCAGGEENIFMHTCLKRGMKILYSPKLIATVSFAQSSWAGNMYSKKYFEDFAYARGKEVYGKTFAAIFSVYYAFKKYKWYKGDFSVLSCIISMWKGIYR